MDIKNIIKTIKDMRELSTLKSMEDSEKDYINSIIWCHLNNRKFVEIDYKNGDIIGIRHKSNTPPYLGYSTNINLKKINFLEDISAAGDYIPNNWSIVLVREIETHQMEGFITFEQSVFKYFAVPPNSANEPCFIKFERIGFYMESLARLFIIMQILEYIRSDGLSSDEDEQ